MRNVLHLYPEDAPQRHEAIRRARAWLDERGLALVLAAERVHPADRDLYAGAIELPPPEDVSATLARLRPFARDHAIAAVVAPTEWAAPAGALLARELSLPGPSPDAALRCIGKHLTREALDDAGVPQPAFTLARDAAAVRRFADSHGFPLVLKPFASTLARLVTEVPGPGVVDDAVARLLAGLRDASDVARMESFARAAGLDAGPDPRSTFLCEAFAHGEPLEADGFVTGRTARSFGLIDQVTTATPRLYFEGYMLPADRPAEERAALTRIGERAAEAVGLDAAGFAVELRAHRGEARVIEVNGRLGEDAGLHRLFELGCGGDPLRLSIEVALGERPAYAPRDAPRHALAYQCAFVEGAVTAVPAPQELAALRALPDVIEAGSCVEPGQRVHAPPHPETFPHLGYVLAADPASSRAAFERARELVRRLRFSLVQSAPP